MPSPIYFFQSSAELEGLFDSFFNGLFLVKGAPIFFQLGFLICFLAACLAANRYQITCSEKYKNFTALYTFLALVLSAFLLFQPWDEVFIFLRHSLHFSEIGNFSFNRNSRVEGIVDFLPFFSLGSLHKIGFPLLETNFCLGILGGWLCILAGRQILLVTGYKESVVWAFPLLLIYPPLLLNVSNGFPVLIFSASLLWSLYFLLLRESWWKGCFLLSLVPLVRIEGLWFCILCQLAFFILSKKAMPIHKRLSGILMVFFPAFCLTLWRWTYFGNPIPVPVLFKSAGNFFYFLFGIRNFLMDLTATGSLLFFWYLFQLRPQKEAPSPLVHLGILLLAFSLPYYLSGGDWFPSAWARYLFPFAFIVFLQGLAWIFSVKSKKISLVTPENWALFLLFLMLVFLPFGSVPKLWQELFHHRSTLAGLNRKKSGQSNYRIQQLSQLGTHLSRTTESSEIIGSSEIATIMFFAKRDCLDLLGLTNMEIAQAPLRSAPKIFSKSSGVHELPYLIFKRIKSEVLLKHRPGIFYAFDFFLRDLLKKEDLTRINQTDILGAWSLWNEHFSQMNKTLFGGVENLLKSDYSPVIIHLLREVQKLHGNIYFFSSGSFGFSFVPTVG